MSGHTPGPWTWDGTFPICIRDAEGYHVVSSGGMFPSGEANARLIAAAPDLLEALRSGRTAAQLLAGLTQENPELMRLLPGLGSVIERMEAAIAKAEGR